jgi:hypothetical protein
MLSSFPTNKPKPKPKPMTKPMTKPMILATSDSIDADEAKEPPAKQCE